MVNSTERDIGTTGEQQSIYATQCAHQRLAVGIGWDEHGNATCCYNGLVVGGGKSSLFIGIICGDTNHGALTTSRIVAVQSGKFTAYIKFICNHWMLNVSAADIRAKRTRRRYYVNSIIGKTSAKLSLHRHIALDAVSKHNHCLGAHNTGNLLYAPVEKLHKMLVVVGIHLRQY